MPASTHPVRRKSLTRPALLLCAAALALLLGAPRPARAAGDAPGPSASPAPVAAPATAPAVTPAAAPSPAASPAAAAPTTSTAAATTAPLPAPTVEATPPPDDQGEMEPSPDDAALEDDPTQEQQPQPQTDQDYVFRSMEHRYQYWWLPGDPPSIDNPPAQPMPPEEPMTISYETSGPAGSRSPCERTIKAHVVALDQVFFWNRLGAVQPHGMIFALRHHVVPTDGTNSLKPGKVRLRADKRPRPLVLRMNVGDCLQIDFQNLLAPEVRDDDQPATRTASIHVAGLQLVNSIHDDGSNVGRNEPRPGGLVRPGERITYTLYADGKMREGTHLLFSAAATTTAEGDGGQIPPGLFGAVNVEPRGAEWYRSQLSHNDLRLAARRNADGSIKRTPAGQPVINYDAVYPSWHRYRRQPILKILNRNRVIVHSDLTAIITGPGRGKFPAGTYPPSTVAAPNRDWPFREHTIIYHDEIGAVQAFPQFEQHENPGDLGPTLHGSRDAFAINYGTGGIGAEIIANRIGVGPMANCDECLFEEFFLSSWTVGDPAMVVDVPANAPCRPSLLEDGECHPNQNMPTPGYKATKAFYPHDPSNVYHGYLGDRTKQRVLHAGPKEHHIHHLHAHQWFKAADAEGSSYNDSQAIGPGSGHNIEIAYGGGGNRNLTPGDSIFHCHFYPHFAQGMWALWRVHDVFEEGTELDATGRPVENSARALPDAEIKRGTPIPAVVPIPGGTAPNMADYVMAPMPQEKVRIVNGQVDIQIEAFRAPGNPGFPFFVPGIMGRRVPHPPLDTEFDAGLPRHIILEADVLVNDMNRLSFDKEIGNIHAKELYENGEPIERGAMEYHARDFHTSYRTDGTQGPFMTNGLPPAKGAPFADPCSNPRWTAAGQRILNADPFGRQIYYKGVMFQMDMTINKKGWHFPQSRIESLWDDYTAIKTGFKPPEPLFFRANVNDCVTFHHANLIPKVYRVDDFQVRTPTDIVGQHIHLVKFDVMASDGAGNGWNYEDGTFGPEEVVHRIEEINKGGGIIDRETGQRHKLEPVNHPVFNVPTQVTIQRWLVDNIAGDSTADRAAFDPNRTLRNAFTHDHFGPSTHQQTGLYAGLVIEPEGSDWLDNETGMRLGYGNRPTAVRPIDGGPTSWQAVIIPPDNRRSYREFLLEFADFQLAYMKGRGLDANKQAVPDPEGAINPPGRHEVPLPMTMPAAGGPFGFETRLLERPARQRCETGDPAPCPEILSADDVGTFSVNYRNEPIPLRVRNPATNTQVPGVQGDLSHVYRSIERVDPDLNTTGPLPPLTADVGPYDPFTPLLRAYENDEVQIRVLVGAHEEGHNFTVNGVKWLFEPFDPNSGYRNSQMMGISEKYDFIVPKMPKNSQTTDFLYRPGAASDDQWNGLWGIMRAYSSARRDLTVLPNNPNGFGPAASNAGDFTGVCPRAAPRRDYEVHAYYARDILPRARLEFTGQNGWNFTVTRPGGGAAETGPLNDPTAILYVRREDIGADGKYNRQRVEPLVLRAAAGDCVYLTLRNKLPDQPNDLPGYNTFPMIVDDFNANQVVPSRHVGLHPQLLFYEVKSSDGMNVGRNPVQTAAPGGTVTYQWFAGDVKIDPVTFFGTGVPIEFGATNLMSSDPVKHSNKSAIGSLVVEPQGSNWTEDPDHRHAATVWRPTKGCATCGTVMMPFREFVLQFQNDINMRFASNQPVPNTAEGEDPEDSGQKAFNYRTEPFWARLCYWPALPLTGASGTVAVSCPNGYAQATRQFDMTNSLHNYQIGGRDPVTPIFTAAAGDEVRFRVLHSGGHARNNVFMLHGHVWQEMPYQTGTASTVIGFNNNSPWHGSQYGHGPSNHFDVVVRAGGAFSITGDYLYRTFQSFQFDGGLWGLFRVGGGIPNAEEPPPPPPCAPCTAEEELSPPPR